MTLKELYRCKEGNKQAQKLLYTTYVDKLFNVSVRYCKDHHEAKDILQEGFLKIYKNIEKFEGNLIQFESWMTKIIVNTALENYRKQKKFIYADNLKAKLDISMVPSVLEKLEYEEFKFVIDQLPDDLRITFNLSFVEGYKHKEISQLLGIKESSSRTRLTRAKKILRELFISKNMVEYVG